ncbi:MAG: hypothetical protein U0Q12_05995 [Vicinamibacterales bacterium]
MTDVLMPAASLAHLIATAALGLFAGAMLTEAGVLVPFWRSLEAPIFHAWYRANATRLVAFFGPVTWLAGLSALASAVLAVATGAPQAVGAAIAAGLVVTAVALFPLYFEAANARFVAGMTSPEETADALRRWAAWHRARTAISCLAFAASLWHG